jgi:O-methyltransferase
MRLRNRNDTTSHRDRQILDKTRLLGAARRFKARLLPPEQPFSPCTPHLLIALQRSLRLCSEQGRAEGSDYLEFGVYRGFALWYTQALIKDFGIRDMRCFGFDSFAGLPRPTGIDVSSQEPGFREGAFLVSRAGVETDLTRHGTDWSRTALVEGWYDNTLVPQKRAELGLRRCSVCVVDCDLYASARLVLDFVEPLLADGSIVVFDDWNVYQRDPNKGERRAFAELLQRRPDISAEPLMEIGGHGQGFILKIRNAGQTPLRS